MELFDQFTDGVLERIYEKFERKFHFIFFLDYIGVYWLDPKEMIDHSKEVDKTLRRMGYEGKIEDIFLGQSTLVPSEQKKVFGLKDG